MSDGRQWTIYESPRVYNSFPRMDSDELREAMKTTPFLFSPFYDVKSVRCCAAKSMKMAKAQSQSLPFRAWVPTKGKSFVRPVTGPLPAHRMSTMGLLVRVTPQ